MFSSRDYTVEITAGDEKVAQLIPVHLAQLAPVWVAQVAPVRVAH
jgi:hypothetical protein